MSYWAKIKAAALGSDLTDVNQKKLQPQPPLAPGSQPPAQQGVTPVPPVAPAATPAPAVDPTAVPGGNEIHQEPVARQRMNNNDVQSGIQDELHSIGLGFMGQHPDVYKQYSARDKKFDKGLDEFFELSDRDSGGKAWYRLLLQSDPQTYPDPFAIKKRLQFDPQSVLKQVQELVQTQPAQFAELVSQHAHKAGSQYEGNGISLNQESGEGKSLGDFTDSEKGNQSRLDQMQDEGYVAPDEDYSAPTAQDIAKFWTRKTKNEIIAPEVSQGEKQELEETLKLAFKDNAPHFIDLQQHLQTEAQHDGAPIFQSIDPAKQQAIMSESIKWPLMGVSDSMTQDGSHVALANWQEYLVKHGGMTVPQVVQIAQQAAQGNTDALQEVMFDFGDSLSDPNCPFYQFAREKATQYMAGANEIDRTAKIFAQSDFRPTPQDISSFKRMAQVAYGCALREFRYKKVHSQSDVKDGAGTALRRGSYVKNKINTIIDKLNSVYDKGPDGKYVPNGKFVPFGDEERKGKKRYLHMGKDGLFYIRTVMFDPRVPIRSDEDLKKYLSDPRNAPKDEALDQSLTMFNFAKIAGMVDASSYAPKMMDDIAKIDPSGLKKPQKDLEGATPLQQKLSQANAEWLKENPQAPDRLALWRQQLGENVKQFVDAAGGVDGVLAKLAAVKKKTGGARISNPTTNKAWLEAIITGQPTEYSSADFATLAALVGAQPDQVYGEYAYEYDKYNKDNHNDMSMQMETSPAVFGRYLIHRKRIQQQRGFHEHNWSNKSIAAFMHMNNAHKLFMSYNVPSKNKGLGGPASEATGLGGPMLDSINNEFPLHDVLPGKNGEPDQQITTPEQAQELINRMNPRDVPRSDIYDGLRPTKPNDVQLRPDGKGGFHDTKVEANPVAMYDAIMKGYKAANPDAADMAPNDILARMKQEKIEELSQTLQGKNEIIQLNTEALNDPQALMDAARDEVHASDYKVQGLMNDLAKKKDFSEQAQQQVSDYAAQRLQEMAQEQGMDPQEFAKAYVERKIKQDQSEIAKTQARIEQLNSVDPSALAPAPAVNGKRPRKPQGDELKKIKTLLDTVVPLKYKTRVPSAPGEPGTGIHPSFKPLDFVHNTDYNPVEAAVVELTVKTAASLDKLAAIKDRLTRLSMPTQFVDELIVGVDDEYENQMVLIARRFDGRGSGNASRTAAATSENGRRLWSLL